MNIISLNMNFSLAVTHVSLVNYFKPYRIEVFFCVKDYENKNV